MKEGSLFCSYEIHWTGMLQILFLVSLESSRWGLSTRRGAWAWFHDIWTWGANILEYWMISPLKIKLNCSWKFQRNWNVPLVLLERSLMSRIWWNLFGKIWIQNVGNIDFKVISAAENSTKFQKTRFWKEKSVENVVTLEGWFGRHTRVCFWFVRFVIK